MKLIHLGDLHLGRSLGEFDLIEDQKYILGQIIDLIDKEKVDAVLIAGDVFDKSIPSEAAVNLLDSFLKDLVSRNVKVFMISGNHDSDDRLNYGKWTFEKQGVYISAIYDGELDCHVLKDGDTEINIYMLPFVKASQVRHVYPDETIDTYEDAVRLVIDKAGIDESKCNIVIAHQFVASKEDPLLSGSESIGTQNVGTVEKVGYDCFSKFDYVALGHIHSAQKVGRDLCRYSGTPLKYSLKEINDKKSVPLITVNGKNDISFELVLLNPKRDVRHIRGKMEELLDPANISSPDDFIYATLTDEDIIDNVMGIFRQSYPNTVKVDFDNSRTREVEKVDISQIAENRTFEDLISDFYKQVYGCDISDEEMAVMREAAREAGVLNEAD
ncbi:MAG: exonuclease SbcCD subunit D [Lachnospiraceae bacterium]